MRKRQRQRRQFESLENRRLLTTTITDVDLDGDLDMIESNGWFENVDGYGNLQSHPFAETKDAAVGDLDGDGDPDIAFENGWRENIAGDFTQLHSFDLPGDVSPDAVKLQDVGGDSDQDIVFVSGNRAWFAVNDGVGGFEPGGTLQVADLEDVADIDNDGDLDAVTIRDGLVIVHTNDGAGSFVETVWHEDKEPLGNPDHTTYPATTYAAHFVDVDSELGVDLLTIESQDGFVRVRLHTNNGAGEKQESEVGVGCFSCEFKLRDFDQDGDADLLGQEFGIHNTFYVNDGNGVFRYDSVASGAYADSGDIDGDGLFDIAIGNGSWINGATNREHVQGTTPPPPPPRKITFTEELLSRSAVESRLLHTDLDGDGVSDELPDLPLGATSVNADLDNDGDTDIVFAEPGGQVGWIENLGALAFSEVRTIGSIGSFDYLAVGDLTSDDVVDVIVASNDFAVSEGRLIRSGTITIFENGNNGFETSKIHGDQILALHLVDVDGDGDLDIFTETKRWVGGEEVLRYEWLKNEEGQLLVGGSRDVESQDASNTQAFADMNGDGKLDIITAQSRSIVWYDSIFGEKHTIESELAVDALVVADLDNDGDQDLVAGAQTLAFHENLFRWENTDGQGTFKEREPLGRIPELNSLLIVDYDRDGGVDVAAIGSVGTSKLFRQHLTGDSNSDGVVNSTDLLTVFQFAEYEDGVYRNATFETGDWNGDREFDSSDLVFLFGADTYNIAARKQKVASAIAVDRLFAEIYTDDDKVSGAGHHVFHGQS